jgi:hypothetical protein
MRKLLILLLVLALAPAASAVTCTMSVTTPETVTGGYLPGDTITIELEADYIVSGFGISRITDDVSTSPSDLTGTYDGISVWSGFAINPENGDTYLVNSNNWLVDNAAGVAVSGTALPPFSGSDCPANTPLLTFTYTITNDASLINTTITITPGTGTGGQNFATARSGSSATPTGVSFDVLPEPATIALFGLGGLLLMRRRK